jgi:protein-S-isoprenylcysteine O-methyltransferase Ste14
MRARLTDWIGFLFHCGLAAYLVLSAPSVSLALLPMILYDVAVGVTFLIRRPLRSSVPPASARIVAYGRTLFLLMFFAFAAKARPEWIAVTPISALQVAAAPLVLAGLLVSAWALWHLRAAFSIEPQARHLTTSGPYRFVRHPIYTGYLLQYAGWWMVRPTPQLAAALAVWLVLVFWSIRYEERALSKAFPEYVDYRARVGGISPRLTRGPLQSAT